MDWKLQTAPTGNRLADAHTLAFDAVAALYDHQDPRIFDTYLRRAKLVAPRFGQDDRSRLVDTLRPYLKDIGASPLAMQQAERLLHPDSVAVITGQQAGLFGGPLFTVYKALTTVGLAARLERELERPVVPIFWVASEDHDWSEVNHAYLLDEADEVRRMRLQTIVDPHRMVYHAPLPANDVETVLREVRDALGQGPHLTEMLRVIAGLHVTGDSLAQWFARLLGYLTRDLGLVLVDPCLPGLRQMAAPVWRAVLKERDRVAHHLAQAYGEVDEAGFAPEVLRDEMNSTLFYVQDGERYVLERTGSQRLRARTIMVEKTVDEWLDVAAQDPALFSANVLCRPVVQDHILPTLAYVGGPSEIAYHPLSRGVFHALGRTLPPLLLRQRATLLPASVRRQMDKWNVAEETIVRPLNLVEPMLQKHGRDEVDALFSVLEAEAEGRWHGIAARFTSYGPQAASIAQGQRMREQNGLQRARRKLARLVELRHQDSVRQLRHIERWLWTDGHLQERRLSLLPFWAKFGADWIGQLPRWDAYDQPGAVYFIDI